MKQLLSYDIKLQWRHGFWYIYFFLGLTFLIILFSIPEKNRQLTSILFLLSDTSLLGSIFIGAMVLFEKQQNVLQSLFATPLKLHHYLLSKTISLGILMLVMSLFIYLPVNSFDLKIPIVLLVVICTSSIFTLTGIAITARVRTINQYFITYLLFSFLIVVPIIIFLIAENIGWLVILPYNAAIDLLICPSENLSIIKLIQDVLLLFFWLILSYIFAFRQFNKYVLNR